MSSSKYFIFDSLEGYQQYQHTLNLSIIMMTSDIKSLRDKTTKNKLSIIFCNTQSRVTLFLN